MNNNLSGILNINKTDREIKKRLKTQEYDKLHYVPIEINQFIFLQRLNVLKKKKLLHVDFLTFYNKLSGCPWNNTTVNSKNISVSLHYYRVPTMAVMVLDRPLVHSALSMLHQMGKGKKIKILKLKNCDMQTLYCLTCIVTSPIGLNHFNTHKITLTKQLAQILPLSSLPPPPFYLGVALCLCVCPCLVNPKSAIDLLPIVCTHSFHLLIKCLFIICCFFVKPYCEFKSLIASLVSCSCIFPEFDPHLLV